MDRIYWSEMKHTQQRTLRAHCFSIDSSTNILVCLFVLLCVLSPASDTPHHGRIEEFERRARDEMNMRVVRWENFQSTMFEPFRHFPIYGAKINNDASLRGQAEVMILSKAVHFIGTGASTFSDHVYQMMPEFGNRPGAIAASIDYDILTGLTSASYHDEERPNGFKPAMKETKLSREIEKKILAPLPPLTEDKF